MLTTFFFLACSWQINCAANANTNGVDNSVTGDVAAQVITPRRPMLANIIDASPKQSIGLPQPFQPTVPIISGQNGVVKSYILSDNKTGVLFVGSFSPASEQSFQQDIVTGVNTFKQRGVTQLIVDLSNNGGGFPSRVAFGLG
jgi:hypothetical protein